MIHEEIVTYEVAKLAMKKGFDEYVEAFYAEGCGIAHSQGPEKWNEYKGRYAAPTQSLLQRWLREDKKISVEVSWFEVGNKYFWVAKDMNNHDVFNPKTTKCMTFYDTWEQALESGLKYALKELK